MRRFACLAVILPLLFAPVFGQIVFYDDFQSSALNRFLVGDLSDEWTLYNDGNRPSTSPDLTYLDSAWKVMRHENGDMFAASLSYFRGNGGTADRWMVSPEIDLSNVESPVLRFRARVLDANNRDGFELKISTKGIEKEHFEKTLTSVSRGRFSWAEYVVDLNEYKGQKIHLAFIQNSKNQYIIGVDDVLVYNKGEQVSAMVNAFGVPYTKISENNLFDINASAEIFNAGSSAISSYTLCRQVDNAEVSREDFSGVVIEAGASLTISAGFHMEKAGKHTLCMWLENINGQNISSPKTSIEVITADSRELPRKNMLLEMFSSGMCTACAPWNKVIHPFLVENHANADDNRGNFCVVKYQVNIPSVGDPCVTDQTLDRADFYGVNAAPSFFVNGKFLSLPNGEEMLYKILKDSIMRAHETIVPTGLRASLERSGNTFKVHAEVTGYLPDVNNYSLVVCLIEDSIKHNRSMHNGETVFYNVTRQMLPDVTGVEIIPETLGETISKDFEYTFDLENPKIFSSVENMGAVVFLQNTATKAVVQARYLADSVGMQGIIVDNQNTERMHKSLRVSPNPVLNRCQIVFNAAYPTNAEMQLVDMQGKTVLNRSVFLKEGENRLEMDMRNYSAGLYFVRICSPAGVFVHKLVKR